MFDSLTEKKRETLLLACRHLTSKEIAQELGAAPVAIDKRIEAIRARLGNISRNEVIGLYRQHNQHYDRPMFEPTMLDCDQAASASAVEMATLRWVDWYNNQRLFGPIVYIPPAEAEANYYAAKETLDMVA